MEEIKLEQEFLSVDKAFEVALKKVLQVNKKKGNNTNSAYINRQRYKNGTLSHKKICEILEEAGFKKVVEEKWIMIIRDSPKQKVSEESTDSKRAQRADRTESMGQASYRPVNH